MKILFVIDSLGSGGAQRQIVNLAIGLRSNNHNVEIFVYHDKPHYEQLIKSEGIKIIKEIKKSRFSIKPILSLRKLAIDNKYDAIVSFLDTPNFYCEIASIGTTTKLVVSERFMYKPGKLDFKTWLLQQFHTLADKITVNSNHQCERMKNEFHWMKNKVQVIYNGVDTNRFNAEYSLGNNAFELLSVGSIVRKKNALTLAKSLVVCRDKYGFIPKVSWAGKIEPTDESRSYFDEINNFLNLNKIEKYWSWLGEIKDIDKIYRRHEALIHPSFFEGLPNAICEALSSGMIILAGNVCDNPLIIPDSQHKFLFDPFDAEDIAKKIHSYTNTSSNKRHELRIDSRNTALNKLSMEKYIKNYQNLLNQLCGLEYNFSKLDAK